MCVFVCVPVLCVCLCVNAAHLSLERVCPIGGGVRRNASRNSTTREKSVVCPRQSPSFFLLLLRL